MYTERVDLAVDYAKQFIGTWYSWGGDGPSGFDCSGLCIEILKAVGLFPRKGDATAQGLYERYKDKSTQNPGEGCLVLYGRDVSHIIHVELVVATIRGVVFTIGASGGGSRTKTKNDAMRDNAFVKVRPIRGDVIAYVNPFQTEGNE